MTLPTLVTLADVDPQPWRNGGGRTCELLRWPPGAAGDAGWTLRISVADIEADGPFSAFPGVERWFAVIEGAGVVLRFADGARALAPGAMPLRFEGGEAPGCTLVNGLTRDLNLMVRGGAGRMQPVVAGAAWSVPLAVRALYTAVAGTWRAGDVRRDLATGTLLWSDADHDTSWHFEPADACAELRAWWLGIDRMGAA